MSNVWLAADWHFGEDRFEIMQRPFKSVDEHVDVIIKNHNNLVSKDDLVYVNGDVIYQKANADAFLPLINELNGRKILIRGNHDRGITDEQFAPYFEQIIPEGQGIEITFDDLPCYINHYPILGKIDRFNIVGHIHAAWKMQLNSLNVGLDVHHFYPVNSKEIAFYYKAICEFYDNDVWSAYQPANEVFRGIRGKQSNYFAQL